MNKNISPNKYWRASAFRDGYLDGLNSIVVLSYPYKMKPIAIPTISDAWNDVGRHMTLAIMEIDASEKAKSQEKSSRKKHAKT